MKSLTLLWQVVAEELATRCRTSTTADFKTVCRRVEHEGLSFLTITLPAFGEDFQKSLDQGQVSRNLFQGYTWKGGLPRFLGGFLDCVFDRGTGRLLDEPSVDAIHAVRQLTLLFGKILIPCSDARTENAIRRYIECEKEVRNGDIERTPDDYRAFTRMSRMLWADVLSTVDQMVHAGSLVPRHGPGATADRRVGNDKFIQREWPERLERVFPFGEYALPNWRYYEYLNRVDFLEPGRERPVRVITVPKTLKTPRIIAIEPTAMQYVQQAISRSLVGTIDSGDSRVGWSLGFRDQEPNQFLAAEGSRTGSLATLDLREASDRVSNQLVRRMLEDHPWLGEAVDASRSRKADVPGYGVIRLAKFASMGSALTFPIEAMVFATIVFLGVEEALNRPLTLRDIQSFRGQVRVYGDDIICPVEFVHSVVGKLEAFGFRVNHDKSFWTGRFRESCGKEYYDGEDVSIVRVRRIFPSQRTDVLETISLVSLRNRFYMSGLWKTAKYLDDQLERLLKRYPTVMPGAPVLGRWSLLDYQVDKFHPSLHAPLVKGYVVKAKLPVSELDDVWALQKVFLSKAGIEATPYEELTRFLLGIGGEPATDMEHLERQGRPETVDIKLRWTSPITR